MRKSNLIDYSSSQNLTTAFKLLHSQGAGIDLFDVNTASIIWSRFDESKNTRTESGSLLEDKYHRISLGTLTDVYMPPKSNVGIIEASLDYNQTLHALDVNLYYSPVYFDYEYETVTRFKKFKQVSSIYIRESENIIRFSILLDLDHYDYDLMINIFEDAEFPIKDLHEKDKLFDFKYIYFGAKNQIDTNSFGKLIFTR